MIFEQSKDHSFILILLIASHYLNCSTLYYSMIAQNCFGYFITLLFLKWFEPYSAAWAFKA